MEKDYTDFNEVVSIVSDAPITIINDENSFGIYVCSDKQIYANYIVSRDRKNFKRTSCKERFLRLKLLLGHLLKRLSQGVSQEVSQ